MAETYRGLTVRIGGDTTSLQKALQSVNSAISTTDTQLRKMKRALSFDSTDLTALTTSLELVGQRSMETATRLSELRSSMRELSSETVEIKFSDTNIQQSAQTLGQLADATEDAGLRAAEALENYNRVDAELASLKNQIDRVKDGISALDGMGSVQEILDAEGSLESLRGYSDELDALIDQYEQLSATWKDAFAENEIAKQVKAFQDLENEVTKTEAKLSSLSERFVALASQTLNVRLSGDISTQLSQIDAAAASVSDELARMDRALDLDSGNVEAAAIKLRDLYEAADLSQARLDLLNSKLDEMNAQGIGQMSDGMGDLALATQRAQTEFTEATTEVSRLEGEIQTLQKYMQLCEQTDAVDTEQYREAQAQVSALNAELSEAVSVQQQARSAFETTQTVGYYRELQSDVAATKSELTGFNDQLTEMANLSSVSNQAMLQLGITLTATVTPALTSMGKAALDAADTIDGAYRDMRKTVNGTEEDFEALKQAAMDFSTTSVVSADQILSIQAVGGELGIATDALDTFAETVANLSIATNLDSDEAAESLGTLSNIMSDLTEETMPNFADALVRLGNNGASTESDIADIASRIGSMGSILGFTTPQILAWASTIASTGQNAEAAGTAISNTMSDIEVAVAKGGDSLAAFAEVAGMSAEEFAAAWATDPSSVMEAFVKGLKDVEDSGGSATATLDSLGITATRQVQAIEGLMQSVDGLDDNLEMAQNAWDGISDQWGEAGDAANEASAKAEGLSGQLSILENVVQNLGAEFGEAFLPIIEAVTDVLQGLYDAMSGMSDETKTAIVVIGGIATALGPVMSVVQGVTRVWGEFSDALKNLSTAKQAAKSVSSLSTSMTSGVAAAGGLTTALGRLGIAMAAFGVYSLVKVLTEDARAAAEASEAMDALQGSVRLATTAVDDSAESVTFWRAEVEAAKDANQETTQRISELAESFSDLNEETYASVSQLGSVWTAIQKLNGSATTASDVASLKSAAEQLNEQCGTSYGVIQDSSGAYYVMEDGVRVATSAIYDLIAAQEQEILMAAQQEKLEDLYSEQAKQLSAYTDALNDYNEAVSAADAAYQAFIDLAGYAPDSEQAQQAFVTGSMSEWQMAAYQEWNTAAEAVDGFADAVDDAKAALDGTGEAIDEVNSTLGNIVSSAGDARDSFEQLALGSGAVNEVLSGDTDLIEDFAQAMEDSGASVSFFADLSESEMAELASAWARDGGDLLSIMNELGLVSQESIDRMRDAFATLADGELSTALQETGYDLDELSQKMVLAGYSTEDLATIGTANFAALAEAAGGDIDKLIFMLDNYNSTPIADKEGNITVDDTVLLYAQGEVYTWNGTELVDKDGYVVVQGLPDLVTANDEALAWNESGELVDKETGIAVDAGEFYDAEGRVYEWDARNGRLTDLDGNVYVDFLELTDALDNVVELEGHDGLKVKGDVNVNYDEVVEAMNNLDYLTSKYDNKTLARSYVDVVTRYYSTGSSASGSTSSSGASLYSAAPQALPYSAQSFAGTPSLLAARSSLSATADEPAALASVASALSAGGSLSRAASRLAASTSARVASADGKVVGRSVSGGIYIENQNFKTKVVRADEDLYAVAPINYRTAIREARLMSR